MYENIYYNVLKIKDYLIIGKKIKISDNQLHKLNHVEQILYMLFDHLSLVYNI
jgi:hypothetical protein